MQQPKIQPEDVAAQVIDGLLAGAEEVLTDKFARRIKAALPNDLTLLYAPDAQ